jgi:hypothetical protein
MEKSVAKGAIQVEECHKIFFTRFIGDRPAGNHGLRDVLDRFQRGRLGSHFS